MADSVNAATSGPPQGAEDVAAASGQAKGDGGSGGEASSSAKDMVASMCSAAAFVEAGMQDAEEDSCSICLDNFTDDEPPTVRPVATQCLLGTWCGFS